MNKLNILNTLKKESTKKELKQYQIKHLRLFGSYAKGNHNEESDIDLLYDCNRNEPSKGWGIISAKVFLEELLNKKCDLVSIDNIDPFIKKKILSYKQQIW